MGRTTALGVTALLALAGACGGGDDLLLPGAGEPATITVMQGDQQSGRVGEALAQPLIVSVTDASGRPVDGATVVFSLTDAAPGASITPDTTMIELERPGDSERRPGHAPGGSGRAGGGARCIRNAHGDDRVHGNGAGGERQRHRGGQRSGSERPGGHYTRQPTGRPGIRSVRQSHQRRHRRVVGGRRRRGERDRYDHRRRRHHVRGADARAHRGRSAHVRHGGRAGGLARHVHAHGHRGGRIGCHHRRGEQSDRSREHRVAAGSGGPGAGRGRQCGAVRRGHVGAAHRRR